MKRQTLLVLSCGIFLLLLSGCNNENKNNKVIQNLRAKDLIKSEISSLSKTEINGLYRFQGMDYGYSNANNIKYYWGTTNYICFGTDNIEKCLNDTNHYMYRIIGIDKNGSLKLIKNSPLQPKEWSLEKNDTILYNDSLIFNSLNKQDYLESGEYFDNEKWAEMIIFTNWKYGIINHDQYTTLLGYNDYKTTFKELENYLEKNVYAKIGLLSATDYYYSYYTQASDDNSENVEYSWLIPNDWEWTLYNYDRSQSKLFNKMCDSKYDDNPKSICHKDGCSVYVRDEKYYRERPCDSKFEYRPVFYTIDDLNFLTGDGSPNNPYIIKMN